MSFYHCINLLTIAVPLLAGFHPRIKLYQKWPSIFLAIAISMIPYVIWDAYFTAMGYWGFNPEYLGSLFLLRLPLEEWLFFICIPYACIFTHIAILEINPRLKLSSNTTNWVSIGLQLMAFGLLILNLQKTYTLVDAIFFIIILGVVYFYDFELLKSYFITFLFMLIPFFIVNGVLTGSGIVNEIVWYNDEENMGIRLLTIPIEDLGYAFSLILLNLFLFRKIQYFFQSTI